MSELHSVREISRIDKETPAGVTDRGRSGRSVRPRNSPRFPRRSRGYTFSGLGQDKMKSMTASLDRYTSKSNSPQPERYRSKSYVPGVGDYDYYPMDGQLRRFPDAYDDIATGDKIVMTGWLHKTSRPKNSKTRGHRQHRKFRLTAHSLEYVQLFQKVCYYKPQIPGVCKFMVISYSY